MDKTITRMNERIELLRDQLHRRAEQVGIAHPEILRLSRKLDKLINKHLHYTRSLKTL